MAQFQIDVVTRFRSAGVKDITNEFKAALTEISRLKNVSPQRRQELVTQATTSARERITALRDTGEISTRQASARQGQITGVINQVNAGAAKLSAGLQNLSRQLAATSQNVVKTTAAQRRQGQSTVLPSGLIIPGQAGRNVAQTLAAKAQANTGVQMTPAQAAAQSAQGSAQMLAQIRRQMVASTAYIDTLAELTRLNVRQAAAVRSILAVDKEYLAARAQVAAAQARIAADTAEQTSNDPAFLLAQARRTAAQRRTRNAVQDIDEGTGFRPGESDDARRARTLAARRARIAREQANTSEAVLNNERGSLRASAEELVARRKLNRAIQSEARSMEDAIGPGGTKTQRMMAMIRHRQGGGFVDPTQQQTFGQIFASKAVTTAGFAASGAVLYGLTRGIKEALQEVNELDLAMTRLQDQMQATGQADAFPGFRDSIMDIARETGVQADQVAEVGRRYIGAYGEGAKASKELAAAEKIAVVTGLNQKEVTDSLLAASLSYGVSLDELGDKAIGLEQRHGVAAGEIIQAYGDMSATAEAAGLSFAEFGTIITNVAIRSGRPTASISEALGRILPEIQSKAGDIQAFARDTPALDGEGRENITRALAEGKTGQVLLELAKAYDDMSAPQQRFIEHLIGSKREAQTLIPLLQAGGQITKELGEDQKDAGNLTERFAGQQRTLKQVMARLGEELRQLAQGLARLGLLDALKILGGGALLTVQAVGALVRMMVRLNDLMGGVPSKVIAVVVAIRTMQKAVTALRNAQVLSTIMSVFSGAAVPAGQGVLPGMAARSGFRGALAGAARGTGGFLGNTLAGVGAVGGMGMFGGASAGGIFGFGAGKTLVPFTSIGSGALAAGSVGMGAATAGIGAALIATVSIISQELKDLDEEYAEAKQIQEDAISHMSLPGLVANEQADTFGTAGSGFGDLLGSVFGSGDFTESLGAFLSQDQTDKERLDAEVVERTQEGVQAGIDAGLFDDFTDEQIADLKERAGDKDEAQAILDMLNRRADDRGKKLYDILNAEDKKKQNKEDKGAGVQTRVSDAQLAFQAGEISYDEMIKVMEQGVQDLRDIDTGGDPDIHRQFLQAVQTYNQQLAATVTQATSIALTLSQAGGGSIDEQIMIATAAMNNANLQLDPNAWLQAGQQVIQLQQQGLAQAIQTAPNADEALRLAKEGIPISDDVRQGIIDAGHAMGLELNPPESVKATAEQIRQLEAAALNESILELQANEGAITDPVQQAQQAVRIARMQYQGAQNDTERAQAQIAFNNGMQQLRDAQNAVFKSGLELMSVMTEDPVEQANIAIQSAQFDLRTAGNDKAKQNAARGAIITAQRQRREALDDIADARLEVMQASTGDDAVAQASLQQAEAAQQAQRAHGEAERLRAVAARISADKAMRDAIGAIFDAQITLLVAMANANGETVRAAGLQLQQAEAALARARASGAGEAEIANLQATVVQNRAAVDDAKLQNRRDIIEFNLEMERITVDQAIAQLEALMTIADPKEQRELLLRIKALRDQASADLQFNVPDDIKLPTLYEVRRLNQTPAGSSYQDNRNVVVNIGSVNNQADMGAAIAAIRDAAGGAPAPRTGVRPGLY